MLEVCDLAPDFALKDQNQQVTLSSFRGEHNVLPMFYPFRLQRDLHR